MSGAIPGSERGGVAGSRLAGAPLVVGVWLERISDGIVVHGTVSGEFESECSRCLAPVRAHFETPVRELFERDVIEGETYPLEGEEIDLELPVRDTVLLDLPATPLCREDCAGLCPMCGIDRNQADCDCDPNQHASAYAEGYSITKTSPDPAAPTVRLADK